MLPKAGWRVGLIRAGTVSVLAHVVLWTLLSGPASQGWRLSDGTLDVRLASRVSPFIGSDSGQKPGQGNGAPRALDNDPPQRAAAGLAKPQARVVAQPGGTSERQGRNEAVEALVFDDDVMRQLRLDLARAMVLDDQPGQGESRPEQGRQVLVASVAFRGVQPPAVRIRQSSGNARADAFVISLLAGAAQRMSKPEAVTVDVTIELDAR